MKPIKSVLDFTSAKKNGEKISMLTCYDHWSAKILDASPLDALLVGDSVSMVIHGHANTLAADVPMMALHTKAVARGAPHKFIVADMPFMSFRKGTQVACEAAEALMRAGAQAVKIEGVQGHEEVIRHLVQSGIPVMGHLGLTPQSIHQLGGFKVQGKTEQEFSRIQQEALKLESLGVFSVVLECVPRQLAAQITRSLSVPTIGIGAGDLVDGQILVLQDMLGADPSFSPKFLRRYALLQKIISEAVSEFSADIKEGLFPSHQEAYSL